MDLTTIPGEDNWLFNRCNVSCRYLPSFSAEDNWYFKIPISATRESMQISNFSIIPYLKDSEAFITLLFDRITAFFSRGGDS